MRGSRFFPNPSLTSDCLNSPSSLLMGLMGFVQLMMQTSGRPRLTLHLAPRCLNATLLKEHVARRTSSRFRAVTLSAPPCPFLDVWRRKRAFSGQNYTHEPSVQPFQSKCELPSSPANWSKIRRLNSPGGRDTRRSAGGFICSTLLWNNLPSSRPVVPINQKPLFCFVITKLLLMTCLSPEWLDCDSCDIRGGALFWSFFYPLFNPFYM